MKRRKSILLLAAALLLVVPLGLVFRTPAPLDLSKDEEPFRSMVMPPKSVAGIAYMDHGSVAMRLVDNSDREYYINFPIDYDGVLDSHPQAYYGETNHFVVLLKNPARAKLITLRLLKDFGIKDDINASTSTAIYELSEFYGVPERAMKRAKKWFIDTASNW
ncbi:MAG: hypothetical protein ACRDBP_11380 [Luteolibacter sp.]